MGEEGGEESGFVKGGGGGIVGERGRVLDRAVGCWVGRGKVGGNGKGGVMVRR